MGVDHDRCVCDRFLHEDRAIGFDDSLLPFLRRDGDGRGVCPSLGLLVVDIGMLDSSLGCIGILHSITEVSREVDDLISLVDHGDRRCIERRFKR